MLSVLFSLTAFALRCCKSPILTKPSERETSSMSNYHEGDLTDGQMTPAQKERLAEWHSRRIDQLLAEVWESDPDFRASVEVMERINEMDMEDVSDFEYMLAADVASWAALNFSET